MNLSLFFTFVASTLPTAYYLQKMLIKIRLARKKAVGEFNLESLPLPLVYDRALSLLENRFKKQMRLALKAGEVALSRIDGAERVVESRKLDNKLDPGTSKSALVVSDGRELFEGRLSALKELGNLKAKLSSQIATRIEVLRAHYDTQTSDSDEARNQIENLDAELEELLEIVNLLEAPGMDIRTWLQKKTSTSGKILSLP